MHGSGRILGRDMDINDQFAVVVAEAERAQAEWVGRTAMRLVSQASAMEVEEVEQAVVPTAETRGALSKAVSVTSSVRKASSDAISLSHWANKRPEGSGIGQGGHSGRVRHHQAQGLSISSVTGRHRRCLQDLQEGGVVAECAYRTGTAWCKGGTGRGSPPKQRGAWRWWWSSLRQQKVSRPSRSSPP